MSDQSSDGNGSIAASAHRLGVLVGALGSVSLAGCAGDGDDRSDPEVDADADDDGRESGDDETDSEPGDTPETGDDQWESNDGDSGDSTGDDDDRTDEDLTPDDRDAESVEGDGDSDGCSSDKLERLRSRHEDLQFEIESLKNEHQFSLRSYDIHRAFRDQLQAGFSRETIDQARVVGQQLRQAVVVVEQFQDGTNTGIATGWFVDDDLVLTNAHNVHDFGSKYDIQCRTIDDDTFDATILAYEADNTPDVALLRTLDYTHDHSLSMVSEETLETRQPIVQVGHPGGYGYWVISVGMYVAREEWLVDPDGGDEVYHEVKSTIPGRQGVSGSPVANLDGDVVGMSFAGEPLLDRSIGEPAPVAPLMVFDVPIDQIHSSEAIGTDIVKARYEAWR